MSDVKSIAEATVSAIKGYINGMVAGVNGRIFAMEQQIKQIPAGQQGEQGIPGKDVDPEEIRVASEREVEKAFLLIAKDADEFADEFCRVMGQS